MCWKPLSAKLLPPTVPEIKGWVDREKLEGIVGRSRKRQLQLAKELGIDEYEQPAGGCCYLTDENFARKYKETLSVENRISKGRPVSAHNRKAFQTPYRDKNCCFKERG
ncbi:MAG: hypothetical protein Q9M89_05785 [Persephonella sp.]|nr:hypothetical protein [Persephonella sp.]